MSIFYLIIFTFFLINVITIHKLFTIASIFFSNISSNLTTPYFSFFPMVSVFQSNKIRWLVYLRISSSLKSQESICMLLSRKFEIITIHSMMNIFSLMSYLCPMVLLLCLCLHNSILCFNAEIQLNILKDIFNGNQT